MSVMALLGRAHNPIDRDQPLHALLIGLPPNSIPMLFRNAVGWVPPANIQG
jgi:hypothetical protein